MERTRKILNDGHLSHRVIFGKDGNGAIGLHARRGTLTMQELVNETLIGCEITNEDVSELPKIVLEFTDTKSIDALITCLQVTKQFMQEPDPLAFAYAC